MWGISTRNGTGGNTWRKIVARRGSTDVLSGGNGYGKFEDSLVGYTIGSGSSDIC